MIISWEFGILHDFASLGDLNIFLYIFIICMASYSHSLIPRSGLDSKEAEGGVGESSYKI